MFSFANVKAIIFDLDDTLVKTTLQFAKLKAEIGCAPNDDILSYICALDCSHQKAQANDVVLQHELADAQTSVWLPLAERFVYEAQSAGLPLAIVTRNCKQATHIKLTKNAIPIDIVLTREDAPAKPDPTALLSIANSWQIEPAQIAYIGDYIYDIQAAHNANMQAWLYQHNEDIEIQHYAQNLTFIASEKV